MFRCRAAVSRVALRTSSLRRFNPVAQTLMKKALNAILDREYADMPAKRPSARAVQLVIEASDGDIRSALNTLQFIVGEGSSGSTPNLLEVVEVGKTKGKKRKSNGKVKEDEGDESANKALSVGLRFNYAIDSQLKLQEQAASSCD